MNVYIRQNNNDLLKYLNQKEVEELKLKSQKVEQSRDEEIQAVTGNVNIIERGIVNIVSPKTGRIVMTLSEGEVFGEEKLFQNEWSLFYKTETQTVFIKYELDFAVISKSNKIKAKLHAAINDSLAEKLMRLTQDSVRTNNNATSK